MFWIDEEFYAMADRVVVILLEHDGITSELDLMRIIFTECLLCNPVAGSA